MTTPPQPSSHAAVTLERIPYNAKAISSQFLETFQEDRLRYLTFEELVNFLKRLTVIKVAKSAIVRALRLTQYLAPEQADTCRHLLQSLNIRIIVAGNMITLTPNSVFAATNELSRGLEAANNRFRAATVELFQCLRHDTEPRNVDPALYINFVTGLRKYLEAFQTWSIPDKAMVGTRIRDALLALYSSQSALSPEERNSRLGEEHRTQIERLRLKLTQVLGQEALDSFDRERGMLHQGVTENIVRMAAPSFSAIHPLYAAASRTAQGRTRSGPNPISIGNDLPVQGRTAATQEQRSDHSDREPNRLLAHQLMLNPNFSLTEENIVHFASNPQLNEQNLFSQEDFWKSMAEDMMLTPPFYPRVFLVFSKVRDGLVELATNEARPTIMADLDTGNLHRMIEDWNNAEALFDLVANVICQIQAPMRVQSFAAACDSIRPQIRCLAGQTTPELAASRAEVMCKFTRFFLEKVNLCRMDSANARLRLIWPVVRDQGVDYERGNFADKLYAGTLTLDHTRAWLNTATAEWERPQLQGLLANTRSLDEFCGDAFTGLLVRSSEIPETFYLDFKYITDFRVLIQGLAIGTAVVEQCTASDIVILEKTVQYFRDLDFAKPTPANLRRVLCDSRDSDVEAQVKDEFVTRVEPLFEPSNPIVVDNLETIGKVLRHYFRHLNMDIVPSQALTHFYDILLEDYFRAAKKIKDLNFKVHYPIYQRIIGQVIEALPTSDVEDLSTRMSMTTIAPNMRIRLPIDPVISVPGFVIANGYLTIEFFSFDSPADRYRKASTGLMHAIPDSQEQRNLLSILNGAIRAGGGEIPPDADLPDDLGI